MASAGCVARLLSNFHIDTNQWVKAVNPWWYESRQIPKTMLMEKGKGFPLLTNGKRPFGNEIKNSQQIKSKCMLKRRFAKNLYPLRQPFI